jgi:nicotinamidase-related amidase
VAHRDGPHHHHSTLPTPVIRAGDTALLIIDVQYHGADRGHGLLRDRIDAGEEAAVEYFANRVETLVVPNVQRLQSAFRLAGVEVIHVKTESLTADGRDRSPSAKLHGTHVAPGSREGDILDEIAPVGDEIVFRKTCASAFNGTNIETILRNIGINRLVVGGVVTGSCVEMAVRDASDRGFSVVLVEDATASWTPEMQRDAIEGMRDRTATVMTTAAVEELIAGVPA